jgi:hypothetical protein
MRSIFMGKISFCTMSYVEKFAVTPKVRVIIKRYGTNEVITSVLAYKRNIFYALFISPLVLHVPPLSCSLTGLPEHVMKDTPANYEAPHFVIFSTFVLLTLLR